MSHIMRLMRMGVLNQPARPAIPESTPSLLVLTIISVERTVPDGQIITFLNPFYSQLISLIAKDPEILYKLGWRKMEELVAAAYSKDGYEVTLTPPSRDKGRDVIAIKKGFWSIKFIDQVKAYKPGNLVTANDVRAFLFVLDNDHSATKGVITTTSGFAPDLEKDEFIKPYIPNRLELVNRDRLIARLIGEGGVAIN